LGDAFFGVAFGAGEVTLEGEAALTGGSAVLTGDGDAVTGGVLADDASLEAGKGTDGDAAAGRVTFAAWRTTITARAAPSASPHRATSAVTPRRRVRPTTTGPVMEMESNVSFGGRGGGRSG
jgi:hypothetical protein